MPFHFGCGGVIEEVYKGWSVEQQKDWKCSIACRKKRNIDEGQGKNSKTSTPENSKPDLMAVILAMRADINRNQKATDEKLQAVVASQEFIGVKYDDIINKLNEVLGLKNRVEDLEKAIAGRDRENEDLKRQIRELEQYSRRRHLEVTGILEKQDETNEDLEEAVINIAQKIQVTIQKSDLEAVHRLPTKFKPSPVIVAFVNKKIRNQVLENRYKETVRNRNGARIYINESLSPFYRQLFKQAREKAKELKYEHCWFKNKQIYVKKSSQDNKLIIIKNEEDLKKLIG